MINIFIIYKLSHKNMAARPTIKLNIRPFKGTSNNDGKNDGKTEIVRTVEMKPIENRSLTSNTITNSNTTMPNINVLGTTTFNKTNNTTLARTIDKLANLKNQSSSTSYSKGKSEVKNFRDIKEPSKEGKSSRTTREKPQTSITPTFLLKGVDPLKVLSDYFLGKHQSQRKMDLTDKTISSTPFNLVPKYGTTADSEIYIYRDRVNNQEKIVTTNHEIYSRTRDTTDSVISSNELPKYGKCMWCRREIECSPVGIPISIEWTVDLSQPQTENPLETGCIKFQVDGAYCTFECCYAGLKQYTPPIHLMHDPLYMDSEQLLRLMYQLIYPNKRFVKSAPDWRLLKDNGGPLDLKEFFSDVHQYVKTPNLVVLPIKSQYIVSKLE